MREMERRDLSDFNIEGGSEADFLSEFLGEYLKDGFGAASKGDVELCLFRLLERHGNLTGKSNHDLSHELQVTEAKVRKLRYESKLPYPPEEKNYIKQQILCYLAKANFVGGAKGTVKFTVEDIYIQKSLNARVKEMGGVPDTSFNREIVTLESGQLVALVRELYGDNFTKTLEDKLEKLKPEDPKEEKTQIDFKKIIQAFCEGAAKTLRGMAPPCLPKRWAGRFKG